MTVRQASELGSFLRAMRARLRPDEVGLPTVGRRRTPGLRRQEVAQLAAVSVDWYVRLEQGRVGKPGTAVLDALGRALRLTEAERHHLHLIARGEAPARRHVPAPVSDSLRLVLEGMPTLPAYIIDFRFDVLAHNTAARALFGADFGTGLAANSAELLFLGPHVRHTQLDWDRISRETVGNLRANLAQHRDDARLQAVIADLRHRSPEFATWWDDQTVQARAHGTKRIRHPLGVLTVCYDVLALMDGSDQRLFAVTPADEQTALTLRTIVTRYEEATGGTTLRLVGG